MVYAYILPFWYLFPITHGGSFHINASHYQRDNYLVYNYILYTYIHIYCMYMGGFGWLYAHAHIRTWSHMHIYAPANAPMKSFVRIVRPLSELVSVAAQGLKFNTIASTGCQRHGKKALKAIWKIHLYWKSAGKNYFTLCDPHHG